MKWFKHLSGSLNNSIISESIERFGGDGYLVFFGILELISDEFDIYRPGFKVLRMAKVRQNLQLSRQKIVKILSFFDQKAKTNTKKNVSFLATIDGDEITINCKRLAELCDNHTQKLLKDASKSLQSKNEATSLQEEEGEVEEDITTLKGSSPQDPVNICPHQEIVALYHEILPELQRVKIWNEPRQKMLRARWREDPKRQTLDYWKRLFGYIRKSAFLMGENDRDWTADLEWIIRPKNFVKIIEGKYHK